MLPDGLDMTSAGVNRDTILIGAIAGARGLKGEVRIKSFAASPDAFAAYDPIQDEAGERTFKVRVTGKGSGKSLGMIFARIEGVTDRTAAEKLKGTRLYVPRDALPQTEEDEFYYTDLIGLKAERVGGERLGEIRAVEDFGAGAVLEIVGGEYGVIMAPFTRLVVPEVDIKGGRVVIDPPHGLLEPASEDVEAANGEEE